MRVVIDTDAGVDDAIALTLALQLTRVDLIVSSFGNCSLSQVKRNVSKVLTVMSRKPRPKLATGAQFPLQGPAASIDAKYFHGIDGLGDVPVTSPGYVHVDDEFESYYLAEEDSTSCILRLCEEAGEEGVLIVTLGPLTTLAKLLTSSSSSSSSLLQSSLRKVVVMAGCGNGRGNATRTAEFNVLADPEAAAQAFAILQSPHFRATTITTVVSWECCTQNPLPWKLYDSLIYDDVVGELDNDPTIRAFLAAISEKTFPPRCLRIGDVDPKRGDGAVICDALAVAVALHPDIIVKYDLVHVDVELCGTYTRGTTVVDFGHAYELPQNDESRPRTVRWIAAIDPKIYQDVFSNCVSR